jgi:hypothetical protein
MKQSIAVRLIYSLLVSLVVFNIAGCGGNHDKVSQNIIGRYDITKIDFGGTIFDENDLTATMPATENYIEIVDDRNIILVSYGEQHFGSYSIEEGHLLILGMEDFIEGSTVTIEGNQIVFQYFIEGFNTFVYYDKIMSDK